MGLWKSPDASETRPQPPDVPPRAGQRSGSPWVVLQHRGGSAPSPESWSGAGEPWPLPFQARWQRGLPHLALSIPPLRLRLAFHMERGTFSIGTASPDVPLRLSGYIPFTKNKLDLKMCEHIRRKKGRWKKTCSEKEQAGIGAQEMLPRFSPPPRTPAGEPSICCVGFQARSGLLCGGRGLSQGSRDIQRGDPSYQPSYSTLPSARAARTAGQAVPSVGGPGSSRPAMGAATGLCRPAGASVDTHTKAQCPASVSQGLSIDL